MSLVIPVPYIDQTERWPTGCESVSAVMLLRGLGLDISVDEFISELPKQAFTERDGECFGGHPARCFVGSPYDDESYGCYAPVIAEALNRVFLSRALPWQVVDLTGAPMDVIERDHLAQGMPVVFWATIDLLPSRVGPSWMTDGPDGPERFTWTSNEHCMLLVGMDDDTCTFNDPWHNHGVIAYDRRLTEQRHREMFSMALSVRRSGPA